MENKMRFILAFMVGVALSLVSCGPAETPVPAPEPDSLGLSPGDSVAVGPESADSLRLAQAACESSLSVNGVRAPEGGQVLEVERLPRELLIEVVDCPNPKAEVRDNFVKTGGGSGELRVVVLKRGNIPGLARVGSSRFELGSERPEVVKLPDPAVGVATSRAFRTDSNEAQVKYITRPGGYPRPSGVATAPLVASMKIQVRPAKAEPGDVFKVQVEVRQVDSNDDSRVLLIREACSPEAQASPSRFDC